MKIINTISWVAAIGIAASLAMIMPALAQTSARVGANVGVSVQGGVHNGANGGMRRGGMPGDGVFGTVSAVNGDTLTVTATARPARPMPEQASTSVSMPTVVAGTVYTVDATSAKIYKGSATTTASVSDIATGDTVMVQGTISGANVAATVIRDGVNGMMGGQSGMPGKSFSHSASSTSSTSPIIQGNGEPVVGGSVTAISGTTLTVTNTSNVTYTINAASATVVVKGASSTIANVAVGDSIVVQGAVNGNSVTASSIIDQGVKTANASSTNGQSHGGGIGAGLGGFFGAIGGFFSHLFGF
jgi:hypothetical protein